MVKFLSKLSETPIKLIITILWILCLFSANFYLTYRQSVNDKCSPKYPDLSVRLYDPQTLPGGGVQERSDGMVYPKGTWWRGDGQVRGCPCNRGKPCLRKCCDLDETYWPVYSVNREKSYVCANHGKFNVNITDHLFIALKQNFPPRLVKEKVSQDHFQIITSPKCDGMIDDTFIFKYILVLLPDGVLYSTNNEYYFDQTNFCVEFLEDKNTTAFQFCDEFKQGFRKKLKLASLVDTYILITSIPVLAVTLVVYTLVPRLRRGHGVPIMCYLTTEFMVKLIRMYLQYNTCFICAGALLVFLTLSVKCWAPVVSYYMWLIAKPGAAGKVESRSRFLFCCGLAWGIPLVIAVLAEAVDHISALPELLKPGFGDDDSLCIFTSNSTKLIFLIAPSLCANMTQLILSVATLAQLAAGERNAQSLQGTESKRHNASDINWIRLYTKMSFIMGLNYLIFGFLEHLTWFLFLPEVLENTLLQVDFHRGVEVFLVFVCQWEVLCLAVSRLAFWRQ